MHELIHQISTLLRGMWQYRRLGALVAWVVAAIGTGAVLFMPDRYEASARVYVDTQTILRPLMTGLAVQPNIEQQVNMLSRTLISRPTVERLIRMADLDLNAKTPQAQSALVDKVSSSLAIRSTGRDNLYTLSYQGDSPEQALRVVQSLLTIFVESSLGESRSDSASARRFIEEQISAYETKLTEAETRLKEFRLNNIEMQSAEGLDTAGQMAETASRLSQARLELQEAESARAAARRQLEQARQAQTSTASRAGVSFTPELDARLDAQRRNLDLLVQRFTEQHPDVVQTRRMVRELEEQRARELTALQGLDLTNPGERVLESSPALVELSRLHSAADVQVASLRARVAEYQSRVGRSRDQMRVAPQIEAELARLNRDYEVHRKNYEDLAARRESINMSGQLESTASLADFRVIDPPRAISTPVAPNRVLLLPMVLFAALAAGLGLSFLMSQIRPVYFDGNSLRQQTRLPVLGVVTLLQNPAVRQQQRRSLAQFALSVGALVGVMLAGMALLTVRSGGL
jgi:polysaccharide chain length determinant protein (PEP-CTERM system associated)